eukprot:COSAG02_NODE_24695_length_680_cov_0.934596_1_plen_181_part_10
MIKRMNYRLSTSGHGGAGASHEHRLARSAPAFGGLVIISRSEPKRLLRFPYISNRFIFGAQREIPRARFRQVPSRRWTTRWAGLVGRLLALVECTPLPSWMAHTRTKTPQNKPEKNAERGHRVLRRRGPPLPATASGADIHDASITQKHCAWLSHRVLPAAAGEGGAATAPPVRAHHFHLG